MIEPSMHDARPPLSATLAPLLDQTGTSPRQGFDLLASMGFRFVQLSAAQRGMRPRELDKSARRDMLATLRRIEMKPAGIDVWIPPAHFEEPSRVDRAMDAVLSAIGLAADLGRVPLSLIMPESPAAAATIIESAEHFGVELADHRMPPAEIPGTGVGIDPAAWLARGDDPAAGVSAHARRLSSARLCDLSTSGMRTAIGDDREGRLDVLAYRIALSVASYARPVIVDARQWPDVLAGLERTQRRWDR